MYVNVDTLDGVAVAVIFLAFASSANTFSSIRAYEHIHTCSASDAKRNCKCFRKISRALLGAREGSNTPHACMLSVCMCARGLLKRLGYCWRNKGCDVRIPNGFSSSFIHTCMCVCVCLVHELSSARVSLSRSAREATEDLATPEVSLVAPFTFDYYPHLGT